MKSIILLIISNLFVITALAQRRETVSTDVRLGKDRPHVYLSFEREAKIEPLYEGESDRRIWLRFHNNSKWKVLFCSNPVPKEYGEISAEYEIERYKGSGDIPSARGRGDTCAYTTLKPGKFILFSLPREHLADGLAIKIQYRYGWEFEPDGTDNLKEPEHYTLFYSSDITK